MSRKCLNCHHALKNDDFLCPECGHICGDPVSQAQIPKIADPKKRRQSSLLPWLLALFFFLSSILTLYLSLSRDRIDVESMPEKTCYTVSLVDQNGDPLPGTLVSFYSDAEANTPAFQQTTNQLGMALFYADVSDSPYIVLERLPEGCQAADNTYFFSGQSSLIIFVENENAQEDSPYITYTVVVLDEDLQPVSGVGVRFLPDWSGALGSLGSLIFPTNAHGIAQAAFLSGTDIEVQIMSVPGGYSSEILGKYAFPDGQATMYLQLKKSDRLPQDNTIRCTVRVTDQYGQPVADVRVGSQSGSRLIETRTNQDGEAVFQLFRGQIYSVSILSVPEGYSFLSGSIYRVDADVPHMIEITITRINNQDDVIPIPDDYHLQEHYRLTSS